MVRILIPTQFISNVVKKILHCISGTAGREDVVVICSDLLEEMRKIKLSLEHDWNFERMYDILNSSYKIDKVLMYLPSVVGLISDSQATSLHQSHKFF